jgi:NNP family nitrate/nitrite transporter-like MFS transporter
MPEISASASFRKGAIDFNTWILYLQYACSFGVELTMNNFAATYFVDSFGLSTSSASAVASIFGFMNIFARGLGGFTSDKLMSRYGMRGRIFWQAVTLLIEGMLIFAFASVDTLWLAIMLLTAFSIFVQAGEGSTYGIVPYINPSAPGAVAGIVGAGGPSGAVLFGLGFRQLTSVKDAYFLMASVVIFSGFISVFFNIKGHRCVLFGQDTAPVSRLVIPDAADSDMEDDKDESGTKQVEGKNEA